MVRNAIFWYIKRIFSAWSGLCILEENVMLAAFILVGNEQALAER